ncbi:hypothetical protein GH714_033153 [Hevea brasiliensis]|uniref:Retrovirus-related Pol polyprotein from transposon TNT 1-94-like beta-barrel domain-containing protein n=1 Tax=Hevea brasiliensis TaxID=3981 RepID=A0A6A6LSW4_HEVBR|nr:hypothetical protein GH714_033153 [Hevea brasiliensis]
MTSEGSFIQPAIPRFDGHYDHWSMLMENFLRSKEFWELVESGYIEPSSASAQTEAQRKKTEEMKLKDLKVKNYLFQAIDRTVLDTILKKDTAKESKDIDALTVDELQSSLIVHEQKFQRRNGEEQVLKVTSEGGRGRGRGTFRGKEEEEVEQTSTRQLWSVTAAINLDIFNMNVLLGTKRQIIELDEQEEMLLMSYVEMYQASREDAWFLDSGCSNHMCGNRTMFHDLDESFRHSVKLGNNNKMDVMGKGTVKLLLDGVNHVVTEVYYILELRNNLLSIGQLQE